MVSLLFYQERQEMNRRTFIKSIGAGIAGLLLLPLVSKAPQTISPVLAQPKAISDKKENKQPEEDIIRIKLPSFSKDTFTTTNAPDNSYSYITPLNKRGMASREKG